MNLPYLCNVQNNQDMETTFILTVALSVAVVVVIIGLVITLLYYRWRNTELLTGLDLKISKADSLDYGFAAMNHAMCLTGVNLIDGKPTRWKIENSWGDENGEKGYYVCSDTWFDRYVFQAAIEKEDLGVLAALAEQEPAVLEPWDPMGTLAD